MTSIKTALLLSAAVLTQQPSTPDNQPVEPVKIADNLYFVGASDISSYLITTPAGHILIDAGYESTVPLIEASVTKLGFAMKDIKILLNTQAHYDHAAGFAQLKKLTGARLMISEPDVPMIEGGGRNDFIIKDGAFPPAKVDRALKDGDQVRLGNVTLTARWTPGHTKGCTTWTFDVQDHGKSYHAVVLGGLTILPGTRLTGKPSYPTIESDYERTYEVLKHLPVDIFLGAHPSYYGGAKKAEERRAHPDAPNPFVDPEGFKAFVANAERRFKEQVAREKQ
jgi:metallo-beta-lactamase class B